MSDALVELTKLVAAKVPELVAGSNLFAYSMPAAIEKGALVKSTISFSRDGETKMRRGPFQITLRGYDIATGKVLADRICDALTIEGEIELSGVMIKTCRPQGDPLVFQASVGNTVEISTNFLVVFCVI